MDHPGTDYLVYRHARMADSAGIRHLIAASSRSLAGCHYRPEVIEIALNTVLGLDTQLIRDRSYFVAESGHGLAACGGWSYRATLFGSDAMDGRDPLKLDPEHDAARIRAFFVAPAYARCGLASEILRLCEQAAQRAGFRRLELGATLSGVDFYRARGFEAGPPFSHLCAPGVGLEIVPMHKTL